jgi:hypothetical protein
MFTNPQINVATLVLTVMLILAFAGLWGLFKTLKDINKVRYPGNVRLKKYKFSEPLPEPPIIEDYETEFSK